MRHSDTDLFRLHVLGAPDLRAPDGRRIASVLSQPKRLGLLTYLALAEGPVARATLVALFWPESDEGRARNALSQAVFHLRRSLGEGVVQSVEGDRLRVPPEQLWCDARELLAGRSIGAAAGPVRETPPGELLEGWNAVDSQALQEWLDGQRRRLRERLVGAVAQSPAATEPEVGLRAEPKPPSGWLSGSRWLRLLGVAALAVLVGGVLTVALIGDRAPSTPSPEGGSLAVLLPHISAAPGAPELDPAAVLAEILTALPQVDGVRIVSAGYAASLQDLRRQLDALGVVADEMPRWILEVSVRITAREARAIGLLHRTPAYDLPGRVSFDVTYESPEAALLEAPQEVARGVSAMVAEVLAVGR